MGKTFSDQFSILHFATGIVAYFLGVPLLLWIMIHLIFEIVENMSQSIYFIDHYLTFWPGGKKYPDSLINSIGDEFYAILGWVFAYWVDSFYKN
jgi:hypothetical protein